jgi:hypothetical protein
MRYRGIEYSVVQGSGMPEVWRWKVLVGKPEMLRIGEAPTERQAEVRVQAIIDRAIEIQEGFRSQGSEQPTENG